MTAKSKGKKKSTSSPVTHQEPKEQHEEDLTSVGHRGTSKTTVWVSLLLLGLVGLLYGRTLSYDYVLDDTIVYTSNDYVKEGISGWSDLLSKESFQGYFGEQKNLVLGGRYRPLSLMTYALEYELGFGGNKAVSHGLNLVFYFLGCFLLYLWCRRLFREHDKAFWLQMSFWIALIFCAHPLHTEVVANVKGRDEILAGLFSVSCLWALLKYVDEQKVLWYVLSIVSVLLAYLSKENTLALALLAPFMLFVFRKKTLYQSLIVSLPMVLGALLFLFIRTAVIGYFLDSGQEITDVMNDPFLEMRSPERFATIFYTLLLYLKLLVWPDVLTHDYYPYHIPIVKWTNVYALMGATLYFLAGTFSAVFIWQRKKWAFWIAFYMGMILLVSNLLFPVGTFMNERFLYLPSIGGIALIVWGSTRLITRFKKKNAVMIGMALGLIATVALTARSFVRVPAWESGLALNERAIKVSKNSARANTFYATALVNKARDTADKTEKINLLKQAIPHVEKAAEVVPNYGTGQKMKAGVYAELFRYDRDIDKLLKAFKEVGIDKPETAYLHEYLQYLNGQSRYSTELIQFYLDVGFHQLYKQKGIVNISLRFLNYASEIAPNHPDVLMAMGLIYAQAGDARGSQMIQKARSIDPSVSQRIAL